PPTRRSPPTRFTPWASRKSSAFGFDCRPCRRVLRPKSPRPRSPRPRSPSPRLPGPRLRRPPTRPQVARSRRVRPRNLRPGLWPPCRPCSPTFRRPVPSSARPGRDRPPTSTCRAFCRKCCPDAVIIRRFGSDAAFVDGWALYAESLGEELGLYPDEAAKRAALMAQLKCAAALVVDTGLHAQEWSRGQAVAYLSTQLGL